MKTQLADIPALVAHLTRGDDERAEAAAQRLAQSGDAAMPHLCALLDASDAEARWWAVRTLAEIRHRQALRLITRALGDADPAVRQCATLALHQHLDEASIPALIAALADPDSLVARLAGNALSAIGSPAVPALLECLRDGPPDARCGAARALALIGDPRAIPALFSLYEESSAFLEYWAEAGLERMGVGMVYFHPG